MRRKFALLESVSIFLNVIDDVENTVNRDTPDIEYEIEHAYGYRSDCTNNLKFTSTGEVAYTTAAIGVVMNPETSK